MAWQTTSFDAPNLLDELPIEVSAWLRSTGRTAMVKKGQALFEGGAPSDGCYWLHEGVLKLSGASNEGAERILAIYGAGSLVGVTAAIDGLPRAVSMYALRDSSVTFFARGTFLEYLDASPSLYGYLVKTLAARLRHANDEIMAASFLSLKSRVARALLKFASWRTDSRTRSCPDSGTAPGGRGGAGRRSTREREQNIERVEKAQADRASDAVCVHHSQVKTGARGGCDIARLTARRSPRQGRTP